MCQTILWVKLIHMCIYSFICVSDDYVGEIYTLIHTCVIWLYRRMYAACIHWGSRPECARTFIWLFHVWHHSFARDSTHLRVCDTLIHVTSRVCIYLFMCVSDDYIGEAMLPVSTEAFGQCVHVMSIFDRYVYKYIYIYKLCYINTGI